MVETPNSRGRRAAPRSRAKADRRARRAPRGGRPDGAKFVETQIVDGGQRRRAIERRTVDPRGEVVQARFDFSPGQRDLRRTGGAGLAGDFLEPLAQFSDLALEMFNRRHFLNGLRHHRADLFRLVVDLPQIGAIRAAALAQLLDLVLDFLQLARDAVEIGGRGLLPPAPGARRRQGNFDRREQASRMPSSRERSIRAVSARTAFSSDVTWLRGASSLSVRLIVATCLPSASSSAEAVGSGRACAARSIASRAASTRPARSRIAASTPETTARGARRRQGCGSRRKCRGAGR